jgi:signal transduction histidine kinase
MSHYTCCKGITKKERPCKNECIGDFCYAHKRTRDAGHQHCLRALQQSRDYIKYALREVKKENTRIRKRIERILQRKRNRTTRTIAHELAQEIAYARGQEEPVHELAQEIAAKRVQDEIQVSPRLMQQMQELYNKQMQRRYDDSPCREITEYMEEMKDKYEEAVVMVVPSLDPKYGSLDLVHPREAMRVRRTLQGIKESLIDIYKSRVSSLRCYTSLDEIDLDGFRKETDLMVSDVYKYADRDIKAFIKYKK